MPTFLKNERKTPRGALGYSAPFLKKSKGIQKDPPKRIFLLLYFFV
jgi:hypothetical protein